MRAVVMRNGALVVDDLPEPVPVSGQVLVKTLACGICGSDLHFLRHGPSMVALSQAGGSSSTLDLSRDVVLGHEFVAEVLDVRADSMTNAVPGDRVVSVPILFGTLPPSLETVRSLGFSNESNGGYAEYMALSGPLLLKVPNGLATEHAATTEPFAVGLHAVNKSGVTSADAAIVHGCGPVGLAVISALRLAGVRTIVAADYSTARRRLAETMGATEVVDPAQEAAIDAWARVAGWKGPQIGVTAPLVQFEAIGVPGILDELMRRAPRGGRITVVGVCMEADSIHPMFGINKELQLQFVLGYTPEEFAATLAHLAEGRIDAAPLITGRVPLDGVADAFTALADPDRHAKILVVPNN